MPQLQSRSINRRKFIMVIEAETNFLWKANRHYFYCIFILAFKLFISVSSFVI